MSAAVVDPVGRNANWSVKEREGEGKDNRIQKLPNDNTFKCPTEDRGNRYWPKVTMDEGGSNLQGRLYESVFPLKWNCRCGHRFIEQVSKWFAENWGSETDEPRG